MARTARSRTAARTSSATATSTASSNGRKKWIYTFDQGNAGMRALLGGKGAGLAEMTNAGLPVPPGFTITTEACNAAFSGSMSAKDALDQAAELASGRHGYRWNGKRISRSNARSSPATILGWMCVILLRYLRVFMAFCL
jgi:hypothetical protein